jgi:hypothetical protein
MLGKYPTLCSLLFPLFINVISGGFLDFIMKNYWKDHPKHNDQLPKENNNINKYVFRILGGDVWKIDVEKMKLNIISSFNNLDNDVKINEETNKMYDHLHILLLNSYMDTVRALFQEAITNYNNKYELEASQNSIKWRITCSDYKIKLQVFKNNVSICTKDVEFVELTMDPSLLGIKLINDDDIIILTSIGPLIFHFNENNENDKFIFLSYYNYITLNSSSKDNTKLLQIFSKPTLPLPNHESFQYNNEWISDIINNKESLLKYGVELLKFAIKEHKLELIEKIYKKCINHFEKDFNNIMFLSIITSNLSLLNEYYPEYILKYSSETEMIIDSPSYTILHQNNNLHLSSFQFPQVDIAKLSLFEYAILIWKMFRLNNMVIQILAFILFLIAIPIYLASITFYLILLIVMIILVRLVNFDFNFFKTKRTPSFIFMNPYINFVNYPKDYNWFSELIWPQPSPFVETINGDIYKTWSGEALLNYKWKTYGKYYHVIIWGGYIVLLVCFNVAARISQQEYVDIQNILLITSIILGFIYLSFEVRQLIYDPIKWIRNTGSIYGISHLKILLVRKLKKKY